MGILQNYCRCGNKNIASFWSKHLVSGLFLSILIALTVFSPSIVSAEGDLLSSLIEKSRLLKLSQNPAWLNLLHYKNDLIGSQQSQADDKKFFLAENGKWDAEAELEASLRNFMLPPSSMQVDQHAQCRFPARLYWLRQQLNLDSVLPKVECKEFEVWKQQWSATHITLLFPSMYLGNPASMFGHTFIRFDTEGKSQLLSPTLSYAAAHDQSDSLLVFSWKGITGGYAGRFSMQPYYATLQEYSDIEQRDIWEYKLNLTQDETNQLVRHLWEVSGVNFTYYFFRENCSFRLLALLDVAREKINMSLNTHPLYAIPIDTVRDVERAGLISSRKYRPSTHNKILQMSRQLDQDARKAAFLMANNKIPFSTLSENLNIKQQARALELADEILNQKNKDSDEIKTRQLKLLSARSHLPIDASSVEFVFEETSPELSHDSARWHVAVGQQESQKFYEIGLRSNFHDDLDPVQGFPVGVSVEVLDGRFRWYEDSAKLKFESLNIFSMNSIVPVQQWLTPVSKKLSFKVDKRIVSESKINVFESAVAMGYAKEIGGVLTYAMLNGRLDYSTKFENNHASYIGVEAGFLSTFTVLEASGQVKLSMQDFYQVSGEDGDVQTIKFGTQMNIRRSDAIRLEYRIDHYNDAEVSELNLAYLSYF